MKIKNSNFNDSEIVLLESEVAYKQKNIIILCNSLRNAPISCVFNITLKFLIENFCN